MSQFTPDQIALLSEKLDKAHVRPPQQYGPKGDYLEGWHVIAEANRIFGFDGWSYEVIETKCVAQEPRKIGRDKKDGYGVTYISKVRAVVAGVIREDFGSGHGYDVDLGLAHESAIKECVTDALKRTLRTFGNPFGLALYDKTRANVEDGAAVARQEQAKQDAKPISAAEQKRQLSEIDNDLLDAHSEADVKRVADIWQSIATRDDWSRDYKLAAKEKFDAKREALRTRDVVDAIEDAFPGSRVVKETLHPIMAGE